MQFLIMHGVTRGLILKMFAIEQQLLNLFDYSRISVIKTQKFENLPTLKSAREKK